MLARCSQLKYALHLSCVLFCALNLCARNCDELHKMRAYTRRHTHTHTQTHTATLSQVRGALSQHLLAAAFVLLLGFLLDFDLLAASGWASRFGLRSLGTALGSFVCYYSKSSQ